MAAWILLKITLTKRGLEMHVRDSEGATLPPTERLELPLGGTAATGFYTKIGLEEPGIWIPKNWVLATGWKAPPVFVQPPKELSHLDWESFVRALTTHLW